MAHRPPITETAASKWRSVGSAIAAYLHPVASLPSADRHDKRPRLIPTPVGDAFVRFRTEFALASTTGTPKTFGDVP